MMAFEVVNGNNVIIEREGGRKKEREKESVVATHFENLFQSPLNLGPS